MEYKFQTCPIWAYCLKWASVLRGGYLNIDFLCAFNNHLKSKPMTRWDITEL